MGGCGGKSRYGGYDPPDLIRRIRCFRCIFNTFRRWSLPERPFAKATTRSA